MKLTNKLDFSLTLKRFVMLGKRSSKSRIIAFLVFMIPICSSLVFFSSSYRITDTIMINGEEHVYYYNHYYKPDDFYSNKGLYSDLTLVSKTITESRFHQVYDLDGNLYTGSQSWYDRTDNSIIMQETFKNGYMIEGKRFSDNGEIEQHQIYEFDEGTFLSNRVWQNGTLSIEVFSHSDSLETTNTFYPNGQLEWTTTYLEASSIFDRINHGTSSRYDQEGNLLKQELYENGELLETIK
jgi:antitoxin component YwqK of YwqJK toxin-antitoxin module